MIVRQALYLGDFLNLRIPNANLLPGGRELLPGLLEGALRPRDDLRVLLGDNEAIQEARLFLAGHAALEGRLLCGKACRLFCRNAEAQQKGLFRAEPKALALLFIKASKRAVAHIALVERLCRDPLAVDTCERNLVDAERFRALRHKEVVENRVDVMHLAAADDTLQRALQRVLKRLSLRKLAADDARKTLAEHIGEACACKAVRGRYLRIRVLQAPVLAPK